MRPALLYVDTEVRNAPVAYFTTTLLLPVPLSSAWQVHKVFTTDANYSM